MSDFISREKLKDDIAVLLERNSKLIDEWLANCIDDVIDEQPTVDAVEVVRCKDCKWFETNYMWNGWKCKVCGIEQDCSIRELDDFCSRGERRDDE